MAAIAPIRVDQRFESKRQIRSAFTQQGSMPTGTLRPSIQKLKTYEQMVYQDTTIYSALNVIVKSVLSTVGSIHHPDPEIKEFLNYNIQQLQDKINHNWDDILYQILFSTLWAGFSVSENLYNLEFGTLLLDGIVTYQPNTIIIRPDTNGMLSEGRPTPGGYWRSGIYQSPNRFKPETKLSFWKTIYIANNASFGNYYGYSLVAPCYKWHKLKEALVDMMAIALDRYGNPLLYVKMPVYPTNQTVIDPATGEERTLTTQDIFQETIQNLDTNGNVLFLPQQDGSNKPDVGALTTGNNIGSTFIDAIRYVNEQEVLPLGLPPFLIGGELINEERGVERRMELYYNNLQHYRNLLLQPIAKQAFSRLIEHNFNRESARYAASFSRVYSDRAEDRVAMMQVVTGMTKAGYFNPMNESDFQMVRQMVRALDRPHDKKDVDFIRKVLLEEIETGRPTGISTPLQKPRPKTPQKPVGKVN